MKRRRIRNLVWFALAAGATVGYVRLLPKPLFDAPYSTVLYARDGELLGARVAKDGQWRFPPGAALSDKYLRAVVEYEDRRFYRHPGVSLPALVRAAEQNRRAGGVVSGGSTLTMQLVRLSRGNPPRTVAEKIREAILAVRIEWSYTKEEILALYAAHAPFGGNVVGVEAAAWRYFGHSPEQLSWAEAATLAVLPNSPALIHPGRGRGELLAKRNRLLERMLAHWVLDSTEFEAALAEPLPDAPEPLPRHAPHLSDRLAEGRAWHTTVDDALQVRVQQIVDGYGERMLAANRIRNAAAVVADVESGEVLAYVGNISPDERAAEARDGRSVDVVAARRSTGSLLKPILYGAMLTEGQVLPNTLVFDTPLQMAGFVPSNYDKTFSGVVSARRAVERSLNVPVVRMLADYNHHRFLGLLRSMGLTTFDRSADDYGSTLILGGAEGTLGEMTGLYAALARSLLRYDRTGRYEAADMRGLRVDSSATIQKAEGVCPLSPSALWFMFEAMSGVNRPEEEAAWQEFSSMKRVAWKTGTSYGNRDAWAIGVTPRYAVGVWEWCVWSGDAVDTVRIPLRGVVSRVCPYHRPVSVGGETRGWFVLPPAAEYYYRQRATDYVPPPVAAGGRPLEVIYPQPRAMLYLPKGERGSNGFEKFVFRAAHRSDSASVHWHLDAVYLGTTRTASAVGHTLTVSPSAGEHRLTVVDDAGYTQTVRFTVLRRE